MSKKNRNREHVSPTVQDTERDDKIVMDGVVEEAMPGTLFKIRCNAGNMVICTLSGKLRINRIHLLPGDNVTIEVSPYDVTKGRVTWRR